MKILTKPLPNDQGPAFPNPLSTNHIVRALYIRAQCHPWVVKNRVPTIGAVCGKGLRVGAGSYGDFWPQASSPRPGLGAYVQKINKYKRKITSFGQNQDLV